MRTLLYVMSPFLYSLFPVSYTHLDVYKRQVCECLAEKAPVPVKRIGIHDVFGESGPALELLHKYGLDAEGIYTQIKDFA